mmetsp:Transcript_27447/g.35984  ORF Transcript_27447/g.35984 Transcript_27447/m.35984 type:complete len:93 (+) Transcript_27447:83-361(+)
MTIRGFKLPKLSPRGQKFLNNMYRRGAKFANHLLNNTEAGQNMKSRFKEITGDLSNTFMDAVESQATSGMNMITDTMNEGENRLKRKLGEYI